MSKRTALYAYSVAHYVQYIAIFSMQNKTISAALFIISSSTALKLVCLKIETFVSERVDSIVS